MKASTARRRKAQQTRATRDETRTLYNDAEFRIRYETFRHGGRERWRWSLDEQPEAFIGLMALHRFRQHLEEVERGYVLAARVEGIAWEEIGWALGVSRDTIRKRWPDVDAEAEQLLEEAYGAR